MHKQPTRRILSHNAVVSDLDNCNGDGVVDNGQKQSSNSVEYQKCKGIAANDHKRHREKKADAGPKENQLLRHLTGDDKINTAAKECCQLGYNYHNGGAVAVNTAAIVADGYGHI